MTNLTPADELKSVRERIRELQDRERALRDGIASGELSPIGAFAMAFVTKSVTRRFDRKLAEAELGDLSRFCVPSEMITVRVQERVFEPNEN